MKLRATFTADIELDDLKAAERYRSVDPGTVASAIQHRFQAECEDDCPPNFTNVQLWVTPIYG